MPSAGLALILIAGCSSQGVAPKQLAESFHLLADAETAFAANDYVKADELYTLAIAKGVVNADVFGEVRAKQAVCKLKSKDTDEAAKCLEDADRASAFTAYYYSAQVDLCMMRGDKAKAASYFQQLKRIDRNAKAPPELGKVPDAPATTPNAQPKRRRSER